jgi:hypothetical protein
MRIRSLSALLVVAMLVVAGCGSKSSSATGTATAAKSTPTTAAKQKETLPPGDIPDNIAYVQFKAPGYSIKVPESFSRSSQGSATTFTDKLNSISVESRTAAAAPTAAQVKQVYAPIAQKSSKGFKLQKIDTVTRPAGKAVRMTYLAESPPDPVTGKTRPDAVEQYFFFSNGKLVILTLSGPKTADNVDPWKIVSTSVKFA